MKKNENSSIKSIEIEPNNKSTSKLFIRQSFLEWKTKQDKEDKKSIKSGDWSIRSKQIHDSLQETLSGSGQNLKSINSLTSIKLAKSSSRPEFNESYSNYNP